MSTTRYLVFCAGSALLATGMLAGCDTGNQQQDPGAPATEDSASENLAMYEPDDTAGGQSDSATDDPMADDSMTDDPMADDPMMGENRTQDMESGARDMMGSTGNLDTMSSDEIVGTAVVSRDGEEIGDVDELVVDPTSQQKFAVVDVGGFLGVGQKSIVIALDELEMSPDDRLKSDLTRETLQTETEYAPGDYQPATESQQETQ